VLTAVSFVHFLLHDLAHKNKFRRLKICCVLNAFMLLKQIAKQLSILTKGLKPVPYYVEP
jgi:hypothetical protein